jgi:hypothetical protein
MDMMAPAQPAETSKMRGPSKSPKRDKGPLVYVAVYDAGEAEPDPTRLKDQTKAKDVIAEVDDTLVTLVKFKNYWENTSDIVAYRIFSPADIDALYTHAPNPLYLFALNEQLFKRARKISHEIDTFWSIKDVYCKAEMLISNNGFNIRNTFQTDSAIDPLTDYGRFLKIWSQDYKIWRDHVEKFLIEIAYHAPAL